MLTLNQPVIGTTGAIGFVIGVVVAIKQQPQQIIGGTVCHVIGTTGTIIFVTKNIKLEEYFYAPLVFTKQLLGKIK